ncbi:MAG: class I SAM-dependent methyltransferase [Anaerolineaceae bacterium]|nr:class I SAM-dependent methyltransferase [Anaerolineaceae bacterium]
MSQSAMEPYGKGLLAYWQGDKSAEIFIHRDDGYGDSLAISHFYREETEFSPIEHAALNLCRGHILDVGAGTGLFSLPLQAQGFTVTAIDIDPNAVSIMQMRGVVDVDCTDVFEFWGGPYDTILLMGHGIGMVQTIDGLDRFLHIVRDLLASDGQVLLDSLDVRNANDPVHLAYHDANREAGRYIGEVRTQIEFRGEKGPLSGWLHVDPETLAEHAASAGWDCEVIAQEESSEYLARLKKVDTRQF